MHGETIEDLYTLLFWVVEGVLSVCLLYLAVAITGLLPSQLRPSFWTLLQFSYLVMFVSLLHLLLFAGIQMKTRESKEN